MQYMSTRNRDIHYTSVQAISQGLAPDGGLFIPAYIPKLADNALQELTAMSYQQRAVYVMKIFLEEFSTRELTDFTKSAYNSEKYDTPAIAPVRKVMDDTYALELWHGPTCAFKDMALQMLPHLLTASLRKQEERKTACVLVATSGDTGKGALAGFQDVPSTKVLVFYPKDGVSKVQEIQMVTQDGDNVGVTAVVGNFDDAQAGVKALFQDEALKEELGRRGYLLSSANSINWGRVLPQIVYYISAYSDLIRDEQIEAGDLVNVCVPTGNFGNILAAYYAKLMGVPIDKLICASNENNVLTDFLRTGVYDKNRQFYNTNSPSMDILVSSNLERLLQAVSQDGPWVKGKMEELAETGKYEVEPAKFSRISSQFVGYFCDGKEVQRTIAEAYEKCDYLMDTHTAVAFHALAQYRAETEDNKKTIVVSTASPYKFCDSVLEALGVPKDSQEKDLDALTQLASKTGEPVPAPLAELHGKKVRFTSVVEKEAMISAVQEFL
ncbi:MAG: threonine synthase [Eubacteriales bacterium]